MTINFGGLASAIKDAGPWVTVAAIAILLLVAVIKAVVWDHSLVPYTLLEQERARTDKVLGSIDRVVTAVDKLTAASAEVLPLIRGVQHTADGLEKAMDEVQESLDHLRTRRAR